jgi:uncharacterized membrane protein YcjF (UPF0283 family)
MNYPILDIFLSILIFFGWVLWIMLMFWIITDIFRSDDLSGWAKAAWLVGIIVLPLVGILTYLIVRGGSMHERQERRAAAADAAFRDYVRDAAATPGNPDTSSDELAKLASLHQRGVLNDDEFQRAKERVV